MTDSSPLLAKVQLYFETLGGDVAHADELYHEDAVLEFPQSGERFEGREGFTEWRRRYPSEVRFEVMRVTIRDDLAVVEITATYEGGSTMFGVSLLEFAGGLIMRERIYVMEGWEAPEWRRPWRSTTPADRDVGG